MQALSLAEALHGTCFAMWSRKDSNVLEPQSMVAESGNLDALRSLYFLPPVSAAVDILDPVVDQLVSKMKGSS